MIDDSMQHNLPIPSNSDNPASVSPQQNDPNIQKPSSNPNDTKNNQNDSNSEEEENSNVIDNYDYENYDEDDNEKKEISAIEIEEKRNDIESISKCKALKNLKKDVENAIAFYPWIFFNPGGKAAVCVLCIFAAIIFKFLQKNFF